MATPAQRLATVQSTLASMTGVTVDPNAMVTLIDVGIAEAVASGAPVVAYSVNGRSVSVGLSEARALREYYLEQAREAAAPGGIVTQGSCF